MTKKSAAGIAAFTGVLALAASLATAGTTELVSVRFTVDTLAMPVPVIQPTFLDFATNGTAHSVHLGNNGGSNFTFSAASSHAWLGVSPLGGTVSNETVTLVATASRAGLVDGLYQGTITVTPSIGAPMIVTCQMAVAGNSVVAKAGGPYVADQGSPVTLDGSASMGTGLRYRWELDGVGLAPYSSNNMMFPYTGFTPGTYELILYVREGASTPVSDITQLTIRNVAPMVEAGGPYTGTAGSMIAMRAAINDPGTGDIHVVVWTYGDGSTGAWQGASGTNTTHTYAAAGNYQAQCTVCDNYGGTNTDAASVIVGSVNQPPTARATLGSPGVVYSNYIGLNATVLLDGSGSVDDTTPTNLLYFDWREDVNNPSRRLAPAEKHKMIGMIAGFPLPGAYKYHLVVNDGVYNSVAATVQADVPGVAGMVKSEGIGASLPLYGVDVTATNEATGQFTTRTTDMEGKFVADTGAGNGRRILLERNGQQKVEIVNVGAAGVRNCLLTFPPRSASMAAQVHTGYYGGAYLGLPYAQVRIVVGNEVGFNGQADMNGTLAFGGIPELWPRLANVNYQVLYQKAGYGGLVQALQADPSYPAQQNVEMDRSDACTVQGMVLGTNAMPVSGVGVDFGPAYTPVYTDDDGRFVATGVMRGEYYVKLSASDCDTTFSTVNVPSGDTNYMLPQPLVIRGGIWSTYGEVFDADNPAHPVPDVAVSVVESTQTVARGAWDAFGVPRTEPRALAAETGSRAGYFDIACAKGTRTLRFEAGGYKPQEIQVDLDDHVQRSIQLEAIPEPALLALLCVLLVFPTTRRRMVCLVLLAVTVVYAAAPMLTNLSPPQRAGTRHGAAPALSNIRPSQRAGTKLVDIYYDVADADSASVSVSAQISTNDGATFDVAASSFSGDGYGAVVVPGTNKFIQWNAGADWNGQASDQMRVKIVAVDPPVPVGAPHVDITNAELNVTHDRATFALAGTNNAPVVGGMWATNVSMGGPRQTFAASSGWTSPPLGLQVGANFLQVYGTNAAGTEATDFAVVNRGPVGTGIPFLDVTNEPAVVTYDVTAYAVAGTNNLQVMGYMWVTNDTVGGAALSFPALPGWTASAMGLNVGANTLRVYGTNTFGAVTNDTVLVTRGGIGTGAPFVDITNAPVAVATDVTAYAVSGTNNLQVVGWMWVSNSAVGGASITFPAVAAWTAPAVSLALGPNAISVHGTNAFGAATNDAVVVSRGATDMVLIPAGSFTMGNCMVPGEGYSDELPVHTVMVSAFYMDKYEVTYTLWTNVRSWAIANGYAFDNAGSGKATNHPVHTVNWYDCVKWCNARSEMQGLTPCHYTSTNFIAANIYKTGSVNLPNDWVNWTANGYRLPTEAEWEKAARGGATGHRFPWSDADTIDHTRANFFNNGGESYATGTTGYHPTFNDAVFPYTSPAGYFAPNGYGLYDMAGNVWEWTWDWYDGAWYSNAGSTQSDSCGPSSGTSRVLRGGDWYYFAYRSRVAGRYSAAPDDEGNYFGFRSLRR